jgi:hypothetical protein
MSLKRVFASVWKSLFSRSIWNQHATVEECIILKRLKELMEAMPQVSPTLPGVEGAEGGVRLGDA